MRQANDNPAHNDMDLLLFSYMEGELTADQVKALDSLLAEDPDLQHELTAWQETVITAEEWDTTALEQSLLMPEVPMGVTSTLPGNFIYSAMVASFIVLSSVFVNTSPLNHPTKQVVPVKKGLNTVAINTAQESAEILVPAAPAEQAAVALAIRQNTGLKNASVTKELTQFIIEPLLPITSMELPEVTSQHTLLVSNTLQPIQPKQLIAKAKPAAPKLSRKQRRTIEKHKENARNQRKADEFMKGNVPYVVPLNPKYF
jgi:hypothetical protein